MCHQNQNLTESELREKVARVHFQFKTASQVDPFIRCECGKNTLLKAAFKCLYCSEWYCRTCAEKHFGKTVEQYKAENVTHDLERIMEEFVDGLYQSNR